MREQIGIPIQRQSGTGNRSTGQDESIFQHTRQNRALVVQQRTTTQQPAFTDVEIEDDVYPPRPHTSSRRYQNTPGQQVIERGNQRIVIHQGKPKRPFPWLSLVGIGMIVSLLLVFAFNALGQWWSDHQVDATYGMPRTYQTDAIVYPGDSAAHPSHYIFLNLNGTVEIIELPHGDTAHAKIYKGPTLVTDHADRIPVTGEFNQVNGHEEMLVHIGDQEIIYLNNGSSFVPQQ